MTLAVEAGAASAVAGPSSTPATQLVVVESPSPAISAAGDELVEDVGIETLGGTMTVLFQKGVALPCQKTETFSTASDEQAAIKITMYRGGARLVTDDHRLGTFELRGIPRLPRGIPKLGVTFSADKQALWISAADLGTGKRVEIVKLPEAP